MCGRFALRSALAIIAQIFHLPRPDIRLAPRYVLAPGQDIAIIANDGTENIKPIGASSDTMRQAQDKS